MTNPARIEELLQRQLDDELTADERSELAERLARDPAARRLRDEYVALEGLLFAVGSSDRIAPEESTVETVPEVWTEALPDADHEDAVLVSAGGWIPSVVGALVLAALVWFGFDPPTPDPAETTPVLAVNSISDGWLAVPSESQNPDIQIVWVYALAQNDPVPVEGTNR